MTLTIFDTIVRFVVLGAVGIGVFFGLFTLVLWLMFRKDS